MDAFENHSMLDDERMSDEEKTIKRYGRLGKAYAPVGHVYSVIVEELDINNPDIDEFIETLNEYIKIGGDGFACIHSPMECFYSRTIHKLCRYLAGEFPEITETKIWKIVKKAYGGYIFNE